MENNDFYSKTRVLIVIGSTSDLQYITGATDLFEQFRIPYRLVVSSAHRTPEKTSAIARDAEAIGIRVIIAAAGWSAGLPGALAAETILPVIGIPVPSSVLLGMDAMLSMVQMPPGVPVATMAVGKGGAKNSALLATQILANEYSFLRKQIIDYKQNLAKKVNDDAAEVERTYFPEKA